MLTTITSTPPMSLLSPAESREATAARHAASATAGTPPAIPGFEFDRHIASGGMGSVWKARQTSPARDVAVKVLNHSAAAIFGDDPAARFQSEIDNAARVHHPGVATVHAGGQHNGVWYCVMQYIDGTPLTRHAKDAQLTRRDRVALVADVLEALQIIHQKSVVHCDLKPSNILVQAGRPIIVDFGLAQSLAAAARATGVVAGTPEYMSPEQATGRAVDTTSDLYTVGVILHELLLGVRPPPPPQEPGAGATGTSQSLTATRRALHPDLSAILNKALAVDPADRYRTADTMRQDLRNWLAGRPVSACRQTRGYVARRWLGRNVRPLAIAAVVVTALLTTAAVSYHRIGVARDDAVTSRGLAVVSATEAQTQKREADRLRLEAERRLARAILAQGDAAGAANRWVEARELYEQALATFQSVGDAGEDARLAIVGALGHSPRPRLTLWHNAPDAEAVEIPPPASSIATQPVGSADAASRRTSIAPAVSRIHPGPPITAIAVSPDGKFAWTGDRDGNVAAWDLTVGRRTCRSRPFIGDITTIKPSGDGRRLLIASAAKAAGIYTADTLLPVIALADVGETLLSAAWSPDDRLIGAGGMGNAPGIWDPATGRLIRRFRNVGHHVTAVDFDARGEILYAGDTDSMVNLCDLETGEQRGVRSPEGAITAIAAGRTASNPAVLVASAGRELRNWPDARLTQEPTTWRMSAAGITLAFHHDGQQTASLRRDGAFNLNPKPNGDLGIDRWLTRSASYAAIAADLRHGVVAYAGDAVSVFDLAPRPPAMTFTAGGAISSLALSPDGRRMFRAIAPGGARVFDLTTAESTHNHWFDADNHVIASIFTPCGQRLYLRTRRGELWRWPLAGGTPAMILPSVDAIGEMAWLADGTLLVQGGSWLTLNDVGEGTAHSGQPADISSAPANHPVLARERRRIRSPLVMSPGFRVADDERSVLVVGGRGIAARIDLTTGDGRLLADSPLGRSEVNAFDGEGNIVTGGVDGTVAVWCPETGRVTARYNAHADAVTAIHVSRDDPRILLTVSRDGTVGYWDAHAGVRRHVFRGKAGAMTQVSLSAGYIVAVKAGSNITAWQVQGE